PSQLRSGLPRGTDQTLLRALAAEPERRHTSAEELAAELDKLADKAARSSRGKAAASSDGNAATSAGDTATQSTIRLHAGDSPASPPPRRPSRTRKALLVTAGVALLGVIGTAAWYSIPEQVTGSPPTKSQTIKPAPSATPTVSGSGPASAAPTATKTAAKD